MTNLAGKPISYFGKHKVLSDFYSEEERNRNVLAINKKMKDKNVGWTGETCGYIIMENITSQEHKILLDYLDEIEPTS